MSYKNPAKFTGYDLRRHVLGCRLENYFKKFQHKLKIHFRNLKSLVRYCLRLTLCLVGLGFCFSLTFSVQQTFALEGQALPKNWKKISLQKMKVRVIDGDTFDAILTVTESFLIRKSGFGCFMLIRRNCQNLTKEKIRNSACPLKDF